MEIFEMIKQHMAASVPFANYTGVKLEEVSAERGVATLAKRGEVENHIQTHLLILLATCYRVLLVGSRLIIWTLLVAIINGIYHIYTNNGL